MRTSVIRSDWQRIKSADGDPDLSEPSPRVAMLTDLSRHLALRIAWELCLVDERSLEEP